MPTEIYVAILAACSCIVLMTICVTSLSVYLAVRFRGAEREVAALSGEARELVREGRTVLAQTKEVVGRVGAQMDDVAHITHTTRGWVTRADGLFNGVGKAVESPLFLFSKYSRTIRAFAGGVLQSFTNHRQQ